MKIFFYTVIISFAFIGCNKYNDNLETIRNKKIYEKKIAYKKDGIEVEESKVENIDGVKYIIDEKVVYDGDSVTYLYKGGSEGFVIYSRKKEKGKLLIENQEEYKAVKIDIINNYIIDNIDTIRKFKILMKDKMILTAEINNDRVYIYKFN